ncbi:hypothetical protein TIFTF001_021982 [Ficus carica]|uniref:Uncharacterized protein n=1 Tax=Ficus carica TaxID=3494 RepID=A0AA88DF36_FICCA|nr:hypothetical protein TIFTF001_021982 [Ficus carica]
MKRLVRDYDSRDSFCHDSWPTIPREREEVASRHSGNSKDRDDVDEFTIVSSQ